MTPAVEGGKSALFTIDRVMEVTARTIIAARNSALLGVHVAEYVSMTPSVAAASGLSGIDAVGTIVRSQGTVTDPDLKLLTAFGEALSVNVADLLNRSTDRRAQLDAYADALTNVATRANDRFRELTASETQLTTDIRALSKEVAALEREVRNATNDKDYRLAGEKRSEALVKQKELSEKELELDQISDIVDQLEMFLELYGEKIMAIQKNREALIAGIKVIDVPGVEDLELIDRGERPTRTRRNSVDPFGSLF